MAGMQLMVHLLVEAEVQALLVEQETVLFAVLVVQVLHRQLQVLQRSTPVAVVVEDTLTKEFKVALVVLAVAAQVL